MYQLPNAKRLWFPRLKLQYDEPLSNFAFNCNLRRHSEALSQSLSSATAAAAAAAEMLSRAESAAAAEMDAAGLARYRNPKP
jgi:hypothetical protein